MQNPNVIRTRSTARVVAAPREISWSLMLLVVVCACVVAAGFFFAARQHFTSMEYGLKNSKLREQLQNLEAEKRRLVLAREVALSPIAIGKAARELGLQDRSDVAIVRVAEKGTVSEKNIQPTSVVMIAKKVENPTTIRTVLNAPVQSKPTGETRSRIAETQKEKKEKVEVAALLKLR